MNNIVVIKSLLTGVFLLLVFLPALEVSAFGQAVAVVGNPSADEAVATEERATTAVTNRKVAKGTVTSSQNTDKAATTNKPVYVCEDCCGPKFYQSEFWSGPFGRQFRTDPAPSTRN